MAQPPASSRPLGDRERFLGFAFAAAELLVELDEDGRIAFAAGAFRARLGRSPDSLLGGDPAELLAAEDRRAFATALALMPARGRMPHTAFRLADAARSAVSVSGLLLRSAAEPPRICLAVAPLPAPPRLQLADAATLLREGEERLLGGGAAPALGLIELSATPHEAASRRLDEVLAEGVAPGTLAAQMGPGRYGLLPGAGQPLPDLSALVRRIEEALAGEDPAMTVAATAVALDPGALSPAEAARALRHGLGAFARFGAEGLRDAGFEDGLSGVMSQIARRAGGMRRAIAERRFRLDFQPIVDLATRRVHHHEALLRLEPGLLGAGEGPQDFVMLAETIGATEELDLAVAALALAATAALPTGQRIAFNVSGLSAQSPAFRDRLLGLLDRDPRAAGRVMVELTESAEVEDDTMAAGTLQALRARGVPVCIDDFGAGAAAFRYLKAFPTDYVKVDGAFVLAALSAERDRSFVAAMVDLSLAVGAKVVAERIETEEAAEVMRSLGVHYGQGWHFGRPGPL
jgi:EAL domain-containing protein (putative c-di-GMP-specific phosphodiesterase class I)